VGAGFEVRDATDDDWSQVPTLLARAYLDEPFVPPMFGDHPIDRFAGLRALYSSPLDRARVNVVACVDGVVVGMTGAARAGRCRICTAVDPDAPRPTDRAAAIDHEFDVNCRRAHLAASLPPHARVGPVGSDPALHGAGVGRAVVGAVLDRLDALGDRCIVLECLEHRERFYAHFGFERIGTFPDPAGPTALLMRRDR
jgi:GNAT superfamily N-acetyltransferase